MLVRLKLPINCFILQSIIDFVFWLLLLNLVLTVNSVKQAMSGEQNSQAGETSATSNFSYCTVYAQNIHTGAGNIAAVTPASSNEGKLCRLLWRIT